MPENEKLLKFELTYSSEIILTPFKRYKLSEKAG
jgi:hypothetical protein